MVLTAYIDYIVECKQKWYEIKYLQHLKTGACINIFTYNVLQKKKREPLIWKRQWRHSRTVGLGAGAKKAAEHSRQQ